jgi:hypothetical protein
MKRAGACVIVAALTASGCGGQAPAAPRAGSATAAVTVAPTPAAPAVPASPSPTSTAPVPPVPAPVIQQYDPKGRRDPFESLEVRAGNGPTVAAAKLTGIVRGNDGLMALIETADGLGYILKPGDTLGDGRLVEIGRDTVTFTVAIAASSSTTNRVVLRLPGD